MHLRPTLKTILMSAGLVAGTHLAFAQMPQHTAAPQSQQPQPTSQTKTQSAKATPVNSIVAIVNKGVVTQVQLTKAVTQAKLEAEGQGISLPDGTDLEKQVLRKLIFQKAVLELAKLNNVSATQDEIEQAIDSVAQGNGITVKQLKSMLQQKGMSFAAYKDTIKTQLIVQKLEQQAVASSILITPAQVDNYLAQQAKLPNPNTQYHMQHILISLPQNPTAGNLTKTQKDAESIVQKIKNGLAFSKAAAQYSQSGDALKGGDLGWKTDGELPTLFAKLAPTMKKGQVLGPIKTDTGYHIVKLVSTKTPPQKQHFAQEKKVQMIAIDVTPVMSSDKAKALVEHLKSAADNGVSFDKLAQTNSNAARQQGKNGVIGWVNPSNVPPTYAQAINNTAVGHVSDVFKEGKAWRILKVLDQRKVNVTKDFQRKQARQALFMQKAQSAVQTWRSQLLGQSYIHIVDPDLQLPELEHNSATANQ